MELEKNDMIILNADRFITKDARSEKLYLEEQRTVYKLTFILKNAILWHMIITGGELFKSYKQAKRLTSAPVIEILSS